MMNEEDDVALRRTVNELIARTNGGESSCITNDVANCWKEYYPKIRDIPHYADIISVLSKLNRMSEDEHDDIYARLHDIFQSEKDGTLTSRVSDVEECWETYSHKIGGSVVYTELIRDFSRMMDFLIPESPAAHEAHEYLNLLNRYVEPIYILYDLSLWPPQYDFCTFLVSAKTVANGRPLHVVFAPGHDGSYVKSGKYSNEEAIYRMEHICLPLCFLFEVSSTVLSHREAPLPVGEWIQGVIPGYKGVKDRWNEFGSIQGPRATRRSVELVKRYADRFDKPIVTITLRTTFRNEVRNSPVEVWLRVAEALSKEYQPVFLPDTGLAFDAWEHPYPNFPIGAVDMDSRLAFYEHATMNLFTMGGPMMLALYASLPCIGFNVLSEGYLTKKQWELVGLPIGTEPPFIQKNQKYVWERETVDNVLDTFTTLMSKLERNAS